MGFDLKSTNAKLIVGGALVLIVVLLLWPKFRGSTNKYEDDYLETEMFEDEYASEDEYEEGYSEQWRFADEGFEGDEDEYEYEHVFGLGAYALGRAVYFVCSKWCERCPSGWPRKLS
jgi:hypothetical protein